jgi:hypothetical protein
MLDGIFSHFAGFATQPNSEQGARSSAVTPNSEHEEKVVDSRQVRTMPGQDEVGADGRKKDSFELSREAQEIRELQTRDREVRAHEAAHAAAGGAFAGSPTYTFERGPDGQTYAVGGEVSIDVSAIPGDPQATLQKAQQVRAAALAPAEPSAQDMKVAQRAQSMAAEARMEISAEMAEELKQVSQGLDEIGKSGGVSSEKSSIAEVDSGSQMVSGQNFTSGVSRLTIYA